MPQITNITLHSFSSEDPNFPAKNLLECQVTKKWKCEKQGDKMAFIVLKLEKAYKITQIDIGNEYSAVVEVLVANSLQDPPKFHEILLATSLMTIFDCKNDKNPNRVKMFSSGIFVPIIAEQKWDLVKVVCTQPFNNHVQFGLSFINLHTNEEIETNEDDDSPIKPKISIQLTSKVKTPVVSKSSQKIGKFRFRDSNSSDEEETSPFAQWKNKKKDNPSAAFSKVTPKSDTKFSIKDQLKAKLNSENKRKRVDDNDEKTKLKQDRNRSKGLFYDSSDDEPNEKLQKKIEKDKEYNKSKEQQKVSNIKPTPTKSLPSSSKYATFINDDKIPSVASPERNKVKQEEEESTSQKKPNKEIKYKPFDKLMEGVTFVISGYQNPERGILRQKALDLGAKYKADWDDSCTHLICAYSNTPKYNQVKGKGKIVSKKWIENCFVEQKLIPWRRFALDNAEKNKAESDEEILCEWKKPKESANENAKNMVESDDSDGDMLVVDRRNEKKAPKIIIDSSDSDTDMVIVDKTNKSIGDDGKTMSKQENDSDYNVNQFNDEQQQKRESEDGNNNMNTNIQQPEIYSDDSVSSIDITTVECQAFKDKMFYLNQDLSATDLIKLKDTIKNMLGIITKNPHKANYIITKQGKKLPSNLKGEIVKEIWIRECFELQAFIPTARYKISQ